jgi:hypothetical protein
MHSVSASCFAEHASSELEVFQCLLARNQVNRRLPLPKVRKAFLTMPGVLYAPALIITFLTTAATQVREPLCNSTTPVDSRHDPSDLPTLQVSRHLPHVACPVGDEASINYRFSRSDTCCCERGPMKWAKAGLKSYTYSPVAASIAYFVVPPRSSQAIPTASNPPTNGPTM